MSKGKVKPFELVNKGAHVEVFSHLGSTTDVSNKVIPELERYVCRMYWKALMKDVDVDSICHIT